MVLQAAGPHFCTGGRYEKTKLAQAPPPWWAKARGTCGSGHVLEQIRAAPVSSFSVLHGSSIGGGLLLGLTADYRVATENATFRLGVAPYGLSPVVMATEVLPMLVGWPYSTRMYVEDLVLDAREALGAGVSSHVRPDSETARRLARSSARASSVLLERAMVGRHRRGQEGLLNVEASNAVGQVLSAVPPRARGASFRKSTNFGERAVPRYTPSLIVEPHTSRLGPPSLGAVESTIASLVVGVVGTSLPRESPLMETGLDSLASSELVQ